MLKIYLKRCNLSIFPFWLLLFGIICIKCIVQKKCFCIDGHIFTNPGPGCIIVHTIECKNCSVLLCKVRQKLISGMQSVCSALGFLQGERSYFQLRAAWLHIAVKCVPWERHFWHLPTVSGWLLDFSFTSFPPRSSLILPRFAWSRCVYPSPSALLHSPASTLSGCSPETNASSKTAPVEVITGNPAIIICACRGLTGRAEFRVHRFLLSEERKCFNWVSDCFQSRFDSFSFNTRCVFYIWLNMLYFTHLDFFSG